MDLYKEIAQWVGWPAVVAGIIIFGSIAFWMLKSRLEHQKEINAELQRKISVPFFYSLSFRNQQPGFPDQ